MAEAAVREEINIVVRSDGMDEGKRRSDAFANSLDRLGASQDKTTASSERANASTDRSAQAQARIQAELARVQKQYDDAYRQLAMLKAAQDDAAASASGLSAAQQRASQSSAALQKASNDNAAALQREGSAYEAAGKFALAHPILVVAGAVAAARGLAGLSASAAGYLATASAATGRYAETSSAMGGTVAAAAALAARGLGGMSTGAEAAAGGLGVFAEKAAGLTTATGLLSRILGGLPSVFLPIAAAWAVFEIGGSVIGKAYADLDRLVQLGEKAQKLDVGAGFLKSFESLGPKLQATTEQMDAALSKASGFLKDQWGQGNGLSKLFNDISATGAAGAGGLQATALSDTATNIEERIRAALAGMRELDQLGLHLATIQVGEKVFGPDFMERVRTGQTTIAQISADLEAASQKDPIKQEQVDRALALNKNIADTKQAISDALAVTFDFSGAAVVLEEIWLKILQAVLFVVNVINSGIDAVTSFGSAVLTSIGGAFDAAREKALSLLSLVGVIAKQQTAVSTETPKVDGSYGPQQPTITARSFPYVFGPEAPKAAQAAAGAAKQAGQAAQEASSSLENLIQRTKDRIEELDLETRSVGQSSEAVIKLKLAHDLERAAKKDGIEITAQMRAEYDKLGTTLATSTENLAQAKRQMEVTKEAQRELGNDFATFFDDVVLGGKKMGEAFASLAKTLASGSLKALLTGEGGMAGLFGTAPEKSGDLGGIFGKLLGGSGSAGGFGNLFKAFDVDKITDTLGIGAETGIGKALSEALKPGKAGGGILSSPLGGGLAAAAVGGSIGYSSASPVMGALGGSATGFSTTNDQEMAA